MKAFFTASAGMALTVSGRASKAKDVEKYPYMAEAMETLGLDYTWETHKTVTNDGYHLTMFRIVGDADGNQIEGQGSKGPLLLQHGFLTDSISWFHSSDWFKPALPVRLFQEGFDVWLGNNRGTRYSRKHDEYDPDRDWEFWDFSHHEYGVFDLPTMATTIVHARDDCTKVSYLGHSLGSMQVFYGMGRGKYMQPYFSQVVALSPCFIPEYKRYIPELDRTLYAEFAGFLEALDIESLLGPTWDSQVKKLCAVVGRDSSACQLIKDVPAGVIAGGDITGYSEVGVQQVQHLGQIAIEKRFQQYEENYVLNGILGIHGDLVKIENIKEPPLKFLYIDGDETCKPKNQAKFAKKIPALLSEMTLFGREHDFVVGDNDDAFFTVLMMNLEHNNEPLSYKNCKKMKEYHEKHN